MQQLKIPRNKAFIVVLQTGGLKGYLDESLEEMTELVRSCAIQIRGSLKAVIQHPSPSHFVREGKLTEICEKAKEAGANALIFSIDLTPVQARNIEQFSKLHAIDRTGLILEIFGRRAHTKEGKLQVELARLNYILPRLGGLGGVMSRLGGGIGTRGPGESELEKDKRKIRKRIQRVKEELENVRRHRALIRAGRKRKNFISVSLVGYTNAGKSTLLNALTSSNTFVKDAYFATLDPKARMQSMNGRQDILFIDTVGFLRNLPHGLIESFHATLEEVTDADILMHVLDASDPKAVHSKQAVEAVLEEIGAGEKMIILALNKADLLSEEDQMRVQSLWPEGILISAKESLGLRGLMTKIEEVALPHFAFKQASEKRDTLSSEISEVKEDEND